ncbi:hypothetical protein GCM10010329_61410 [Streptomyces spiroverticillatus]|uniref:Secreted protein n=1 Tax=Streptomyces finlayi TaxID=67296 RepID=A0A918X6D0_9ACTN|nr:hypothetical protein [Streptomyces finlayi]GHA29959.1 hypothetical protein GCM10010329_61410 [Streptomyces spiroverticillatus]GHD15179.1 hypothetical protein GCM10010334_75040 [Streptomyces finlayi]
MRTPRLIRTPRLTASLAAGAALLTSLTVALAPAAHAASVSSGTSAKGGYAIADVSDLGYLYVCDEGAKDGLRAVAHFYPEPGRGQYLQVQDADGSNNGCGPSRQLGLPRGVTYSLVACLRDGANGSDMYCRTTTGVIT